jgi:hypothetical protein
LAIAVIALSSSGLRFRVFSGQGRKLGGEVDDGLALVVGSPDDEPLLSLPGNVASQRKAGDDGASSEQLDDDGAAGGQLRLEYDALEVEAIGSQSDGMDSSSDHGVMAADLAVVDGPASGSIECAGAEDLEKLRSAVEERMENIIACRDIAASWCVRLRNMPEPCSEINKLIDEIDSWVMDATMYISCVGASGFNIAFVTSSENVCAAVISELALLRMSVGRHIPLVTQEAEQRDTESDDAPKPVRKRIRTKTTL